MVTTTIVAILWRRRGEGGEGKNDVVLIIVREATQTQQYCCLETAVGDKWNDPNLQVRDCVSVGGEKDHSSLFYKAPKESCKGGFLQERLDNHYPFQQ